MILHLQRSRVRGALRKILQTKKGSVLQEDINNGDVRIYLKIQIFHCDNILNSKQTVDIVALLVANATLENVHLGQ